MIIIMIGAASRQPDERLRFRFRVRVRKRVRSESEASPKASLKASRVVSGVLQPAPLPPDSTLGLLGSLAGRL